ncbi:hypothetical protein DLE54_04315 [Psychrobacter sp. YP14]|nr:hypothetical protein DLE54_04315 [Psychrobacter sp. YP14]
MFTKGSIFQRQASLVYIIFKIAFQYKPLSSAHHQFAVNLIVPYNTTHFINPRHDTLVHLATTYGGISMYLFQKTVLQMTQNTMSDDLGTVVVSLS